MVFPHLDVIGILAQRRSFLNLAVDNNLVVFDFNLVPGYTDNPLDAGFHFRFHRIAENDDISPFTKGSPQSINSKRGGIHRLSAPRDNIEVDQGAWDPQPVATQVPQQRSRQSAASAP